MLHRTLTGMSALGLVAASLLGGAVVAAPQSVAATGTYTQSTSMSIPNSIDDDQSGTITVRDADVANPYPAVANTSGLSGTIADVDVLLLDVSHTVPDDLDVLLVGPDGQQVVLMSDAGGTHPVSGVTLTFDDEATTSLPDATQTTSGSYRPSNYVPGDSWPGPATDASTAGTSLSVFDGSNPNGTWNLYVVDDETSGASEILTGFQVVVSVTPPATPYPSGIQVSGALNGVTDVDVVLQGLTSPAASDLDLMLVGPGGHKTMLSSDAGGAATAAALRFDDEASGPMPQSAPVASGSYQPTNYSTAQSDSFRSPAPDSATAAASLSTFDGTDPNGTWNLYAIDDDAGGGPSQIQSWSLEITTVDGPAAPAIASPATATYDTDGAVTLSGSAPAGGPVRLYDGSALLTTVTASASGAWSAALTNVAAGSHPYTATALDSFGNESAASSTVTVTVDTTAPSGAMSVNEGAARTNRSAVSLALAATDAGTGVASMRLSNDGTTWTALEPYAATTAWTLTSGNGARTVFVQFLDAAGNVSGITSDAILVDSVKPKVARTKPVHKAVNVRAGSNLKAFFSEAIAQETLTKATVRLTKKGSSKAIKATLRYHQIGRKLVINPAKRLRPRSTYKVLIRTGVRDLAGNPLDQKPRFGLQPMRWSITTG